MFSSLKLSFLFAVIVLPPPPDEGEGELQTKHVAM